MKRSAATLVTFLSCGCAMPDGSVTRMGYFARRVVGGKKLNCYNVGVDSQAELNVGVDSQAELDKTIRTCSRLQAAK